MATGAGKLIAPVYAGVKRRSLLTVTYHASAQSIVGDGSRLRRKGAKEDSQKADKNDAMTPHV